jgi:hypothetical protein
VCQGGLQARPYLSAGGAGFHKFAWLAREFLLERELAGMYFSKRSLSEMIMIRNILFRNDVKTALKTRVLSQKSKTEMFKIRANRAAGTSLGPAAALGLRLSDHWREFGRAGLAEIKAPAETTTGPAGPVL